MAVIKLSAKVFVTIALLMASMANAAVLPEDRADLMYHSYDGGGMTIDGPAVLVRKKAGESVSMFGYYYADMVSSASIDVVTTASAYEEDRDEYSAGIDYLHGKSTMSLSYTYSDESDYTANTVSAGVSHDMFGDLTTISMGFTYGWDDVGKNGEPGFDEEATHRKYRLGLTQVLTPEWITSFKLEAITDEGYLNNPYRSVRYADPTVPQGFSYQPEVYPDTRTSVAVGVSSRYYLPYRAALELEARYFDDDWEIQAYNLGVSYLHPLSLSWININWPGKDLMLEAKVRYYSQSEAEFYSDLFPYRDAQNFLARDKELSDFHYWTLGLGVSYKLPIQRWSEASWTESVSSSVTLQWDHMEFDYNNFRDVRDDTAAGEEGLYSFSAEVIRAFISVYY